MIIVVLGRTDKATKAVENIASDTYHYASNADDAIEAVEQTVAEMLVIENGHSIKSPLTEIMTELQRMPQEVRLLVLSSSRQYFILANSTFNSSVNYNITEKMPTENKNE